jgi:hypothetical protein
MGEELAGMLKEIIPIKNLCGRLKLSETYKNTNWAKVPGGGEVTPTHRVTTP